MGGPPAGVGPMGSVVGPGGSKVSVLKATYLNQYKQRFTQASSASFSATMTGKEATPIAPPTQPSGGAPPPKKRKSRWD